jgi:hypothetical protein
MSLRELDNLVASGQLKREDCAQSEFSGLPRSGRARLTDAQNQRLSSESRFDLGYNAAHALSLAALRWHGYRSEKRYIVFQALQHTLGIPAKVWRGLAKCHERRNSAEYEGYLDIDDQLLSDLLAAAETVWTRVSAFGPVVHRK